MPKISRHGGPTHWSGEPGPQLLDLPPGAVVVAVEAEAKPKAKGGGQPSAGSSTSTSDASTRKQQPTKPTGRQQRAPSAGNHSKPVPVEEPSTAGSTAGDTPTTGSDPAPVSE